MIKVPQKLLITFRVVIQILINSPHWFKKIYVQDLFLEVSRRIKKTFLRVDEEAFGSLVSDKHSACSFPWRAQSDTPKHDRSPIRKIAGKISRLNLLTTSKL